MSRRILAAVSNLFFVGKLQAAAKQASVELTFASSADDLLEKAQGGTELIVLDLGDQEMDAVGAIRRVRSAPETAGVAMLGFVRHTDPERAEAARQAGCERVLARSEFSAQLVDILRG